MVKIEKMSSTDINAVRRIHLIDEQVKFACTVDAFLSDVDATTSRFVIKANDTVVGFFKLDITFSSYHDFCPSTYIITQLVVI